MINLTLVDRFLFFRAPGRRIEIFPDDIFLVSYPRSGSTWMRFLITTLLERHSPDFDESTLCLLTFTARVDYG
jgi:hypothetical protein